MLCFDGEHGFSDVSWIDYAANVGGLATWKAGSNHRMLLRAWRCCLGIG